MKTRLIILLLFAFCFGIKNASAQATYTWTGAQNNQWTDAIIFNWSAPLIVGYPGLLVNNDIANFNTNATVTISGSLPATLDLFGPNNTISSLVVGANCTVNLYINYTTLSVTNSITIGAGGALNIYGSYGISGTAAITMGAGATLTTNSTSNPLTAASITALSSTITLAGTTAISGATTINYPGTTTLTTTATGNTFGSFILNENGSSVSTLTWNGAGTSTVGTSGSTVYAGSTLNISAGGTVNFTGSLSLNNSGTAVASLVNSGALTFTGAALSTQALSSAGTSITNNSSGSITLSANSNSQINLGTYTALSNSGTITANAASTINVSNANSVFTNNSTGTVLVTGSAATALNLSGSPSSLSNAGLLTFTSSTLSASANTTAITNTGTLAFNAGIATFSGIPFSFTNSGTVNLNASSTFTFSANTSTFTNTGTFNGTSATFAYTGNAGGTLTFNNTSPGKIIATSCSLNFQSNSPETYTNTGTITLTTSPLTFGTGKATFNNSGTLSALTSSTINVVVGGSSGGIFNTGTLNVTSSNILLNAIPSTITNSVSGVVNISGSTVTMAQGSNFTNSGTGAFTVNGNSTINFGYGSYITNSGIFYAGTSGLSTAAACAIVAGATSQTSYITNSGYFYLGSTSYINPLGSPGFTITNSGYFTLQSDTYGTANIGTLGSASTVDAGGSPFYVQRYLPGGTTSKSGTVYTARGYRMLSSPVNISSNAAGAGNLAVNYINTTYTDPYSGTVYYGALTGGKTGTGFTVTNSNPTMYLYDERVVASDASYTSGKHIGITQINASGSGVSLANGSTGVNIPVGNGYIFYFIGNNQNTSTKATGSPTTGPEPTTIMSPGYINQQSVTVNLWYTPTGGAGKLSNACTTNPGYNMVGNPYPCTINLATVLSDNSASIDNIYLLTNTSPGQSYIAYTASGTSAPSSGYAVSGQGFIAHVKSTAGTTATLKFLETEKAVTQQLSGTALLMSVPVTPTQTVNSLNADNMGNLPAKTTNTLVTQSATTLTGIYMKLTQDSIIYDYCGIYFSKNWASKFEDGDALDLDGASPQVYMSSFTSDGVRVAVNHQPDYTKGARIRLYANANTDGLYHLSMEDIRNIDTTMYSIFLIDNYQKDSLDIGHYGSYAFNVARADTSTYGGYRFVLAIEPRPAPPYELASFTGQKVETGVQLTWKTYNEGNYTGFVLQKQLTGGQYTMLDSAQSNGDGTYSYIDINPIKGNNVYRLQQYDINGNITYSALVTISYNILLAGGVFMAYPNPAKALITFSMNTTTASTPNYTANIYNSAGQLMGRRQVNANSWTQDVTSYKPGTYIIQLQATTGDMVGQSKFVKTN